MRRYSYLAAAALLATAAIVAAVASCSEDESATTSSAPSSAQLVSNYLNWQPPKYSADFPNPYYEQVVAAGAGIVPALIGAHRKGERLSPYIAHALREIGDPSAFAFLLEAFKSDPRQDIALAIGSSWRAPEVDETFRSLDRASLGKLLSLVLRQKWDSLKDQNPDVVKRYVLEHLEEIIKNCRPRGKPLMG